MANAEDNIKGNFESQDRNQFRFGDYAYQSCCREKNIKQHFVPAPSFPSSQYKNYTGQKAENAYKCDAGPCTDQRAGLLDMRGRKVFYLHNEDRAVGGVLQTRRWAPPYMLDDLA